jgi:hypothetical protein
MYMNVFCKKFLLKKKYDNLLEERVFDPVTDRNEMGKCLRNSLKIFEAIYWKGYEFTKYYVENFLEEHK